MNIKTALKYRLYDNKRSVLIFYSVIVSILVLFFVSAILFDSLNGSTRGIEVATLFFLFVLGLNSFKEQFRFFMQNGISRRTMLISQLITALIICAVMSVIDNIILLIFKNIFNASGTISYVGLFELIYGNKISIGTILQSFLFCFCIYSVFISLGYFITTLYYRMNKGLKIAVSISIPTLLFVIMPILDVIIFKNNFYIKVGKFFTFIFSTPLTAMFSSIVFSAILIILSWLLVKKAVARD